MSTRPRDGHPTRLLPPRQALALAVLLLPGATACERPSSPTDPALEPTSVEAGSGPAPSQLVSGLVIQALDESRAHLGHVSGESYAVATGPGFATARANIQGAFSGASFQGVPAVTPAGLAGADVFVIGQLATDLTDAEVCYLETYVEYGGAVLESRNMAEGRELLTTVAGPFTGGGHLGFNNAAPPHRGSFGRAFYAFTGAATVFHDWGEAEAMAYFTNIYKTEKGFLRLVESQDRAGRAVIVGDEEIFMTGSFNGERAGQLLTGRDNNILLLNTVEWLSGAPGLSPDADFSACDPTDTTPPTLSYQVEADLLWPPDHKLRTVLTGIGATDDHDDAPTLSIVVASDEPLDGTGDGSTGSDWAIVDNADGTFDVQVRAERSGSGSGRTYTVTMTASDTSGNVVRQSVDVTVRHHMGKGKGR